MNDIEPPLVAHVIFRFGVGGLENGLVNLINGMSRERYRHAVVCIDRATGFEDRLTQEIVDLVEIRKSAGTDLKAFGRLYRAFRTLKPAIVHTRNLAGLDALLPAALAGVKCRIHGEHGWDISDVSASNRKYRLLRRLHAPLVSKYVALSSQLSDYLQDMIGLAPDRICRITNGIDTVRFAPGADKENLRTSIPLNLEHDSLVVGTVGRLEPEKDPVNLVEAFGQIVSGDPTLRSRLRLVLAGDGSLRPEIEKRLCELEIQDIAWVPGARDDIATILQCLDIFVLPSLAEGISNTILEAMATGLPVVATNVGGNPELVVHDETGLLVPADDSAAMASAISRYIADPETRERHGTNGRNRAVCSFALSNMIERYQALYDEQLAGMDKGALRC